MSGFLFLKYGVALLLRRFSRCPIEGLYLYGRWRRFVAAARDNFSEFGELLFWKPRLNGLTALTVAQTERKLAVASRNGQKLDIFGRYFERYGALGSELCGSAPNPLGSIVWSTAITRRLCSSVRATSKFF